jgi:hypothetical protein
VELKLSDRLGDRAQRDRHGIDPASDRRTRPRLARWTRSCAKPRTRGGTFGSSIGRRGVAFAVLRARDAVLRRLALWTTSTERLVQCLTDACFPAESRSVQAPSRRCRAARLIRRMKRALPRRYLAPSTRAVTRHSKGLGNWQTGFEPALVGHHWAPFRARGRDRRRSLSKPTRDPVPKVLRMARFGGLARHGVASDDLRAREDSNL